MFPLGSVLLPTAVLPLHIFEERYRQLAHDCLAGDREFGVTLIERGSEVGGGELRSRLGTLAQIVDAHELPDGRWAVVAIGTRRIRVQQWLDDSPYPRAEVEYWDDAADPRPPKVSLADVFDRYAEVTALLHALGAAPDRGPPEFSNDEALASYQVGAVAPLGAFDRQRVLAAPSVSARLDLVHELLTEQRQLLEAELGTN
ncbi:MAG: LON peptidase substrate-binding domain-containing protein [Acidimicrobiia bacterium]|nr:LON peptidase substrate-binding domain-containing protein [Acidimicrobiia bacterium]